MKKGFTMIELVFVIVIIGVLAAIAIPKLTDTKSAADGSKIGSNLATCINEAGSEYLTKNTMTVIATATQSNSCKDADRCYNFTNTAGVLNVVDNAGTTDDADACTAAHLISAKAGTSAATPGVNHSFK